VCQAFSRSLSYQELSILVCHVGGGGRHDIFPQAALAPQVDDCTAFLRDKKLDQSHAASSSAGCHAGTIQQHDSLRCENALDFVAVSMQEAATLGG
jgi:hypothetical protein